VDLRGLVERLDLAGRVHLLGYVDFAGLEEAIAATDLCLNLRYPTAGETSASLLRILAVGRPAVVSDYAQFRDLPDEAVLKVPLLVGEEGDADAAAMAARLAELLAAPAELARRGAAARDYVAREHDPGRAAAAMVAACEELAAAAPPGPAPADAFAASALVWERLAGEVEIAPLAGWAPGERRTLDVTLRNTGDTRWLAATRGRGGMAIWVEVLGDGLRVVDHLPWIELPRDLAPGEAHTFTVTLRRPLGMALLKVVPRLVGLGDARHYGGPLFEAEV
ncbi:MAG TPA: hypothetical protein VGV61_10780, partial [Thermoanaerobaculia bacterium]|nr:hypothetical protein [Thermoanaerobaculia bacterium]